MKLSDPNFYSLHVGVAYVDEQQYNNLLTSLPCCENDALAMKEFAEILGYKNQNVNTLLNKDASVINFQQQLTTFSKNLKAGDFLLITYSGHGGRIPQLVKHGDDDKDLEMNETWCLFDRQMLDIELIKFWESFDEGVNIVVLMDSCHSGGGLRDLTINHETSWWTSKSVDEKQTKEIVKEGSETHQLYCELQKEYIDYQPEVKANILHLPACKKDEVALAGPFMSKYTRIFLDIFSEGDFSNYKELFENIFEQHKKIRTYSHEYQTPLYNDEEFGNPSSFFKDNFPFLMNGETVNKEQLLKIGELTKWIKGDDVVEETNTGLIIDTDDLDDSSILKNDNWSSILADDTKSPSESKGLYWQPSSKQFKNSSKAWDLAYAKYYELEKKGEPVFVEPTFYEEVKNAKAYGTMSKGINSFLQRWPSPSEDEFSWYLKDEFSQLAKAREHVLDYLEDNNLDGHVRVAHIDTGIRYEHVAFNDTNINKILAKSFIPGEEDNPAVDRLARERNSKGNVIPMHKLQRMQEQDFHGTATLAILSGGYISDKYSFGGYKGEIGGIPFAEIVPLRISETVALTGAMFNVKEFAQAIKYAISDKCKCNVVTMSMAGSPSRAWAKVINEAYEKGCVVVTAAGNSWRKNDDSFQWRQPIRSTGRKIGTLAQSMLPKKIMYPARFSRVIAATGVTHNKQPYIFDANTQYTKTAGGEFMQGNYGPQWAMDYAIAGYTPNVPWAELDENNNSVFLRSGGGTSSATPQVAAAAALYMAKYKSEMQEKYGETPNWMWAESTRQALFNAADASYPHTRKYLGMGTIKAFDALQIPPPPANKLKKNEQESKIFTGFTTFIKQFFNKNGKEENLNRPVTPLEEMIELEALQILHRDPELMQYAGVMESKDLNLSDDDVKDIFAKIKKSEFASNTLKSFGA